MNRRRGPTGPIPDRWVPLRWRVAARVQPRHVDLMLRVRPQGALSGFGPRLAAMEMPADLAAAAGSRIRSLDQWSEAWTWAASRALGSSRERRAIDDDLGAMRDLRDAALAYHVASWMPAGGAPELRALRANASTLFARAIALLEPAVERVSIPWKAGELPGYLVRPHAAVGPAPLAVLLNGITTSKEELLHWSDAFLREGIAVLALDWPGSGESALHHPPDPDCVGLPGLLRATVEDLGGLDPRRIGLVGISLGGALAVRIAARDPRIAAVVSVTPPHSPPRWLHRLSPLLRRQFIAQAGSEEAFLALSAAFALDDAALELDAPLLVLGAGGDTVVPPGEAIALAAAVGDRATLVWYPEASHALFDLIPLWTADAAAWLAASLGSASTRVDAGRSPNTPSFPPHP